MATARWEPAAGTHADHYRFMASVALFFRQLMAVMAQTMPEMPSYEYRAISIKQ
jgi:hypothetical protein